MSPETSGVVMAGVSPTHRFWAQRRVFLTGHTGFKGSWLSLWLSRMGAELVGYSNGVPTDPSMFDAVGLEGRIDSVDGDVRDFPALAEVLSDAAPSVVFHLAAQPLVRQSYEDPIETLATNIMGTVNVLESVRQASTPVDAVVIVTTDKCYENRSWEYGYRETDRLGGKDPYSASKAAAELVTHAYRESLLDRAADPRIVTVRAGNVIGGGDFAADRLIPDLVRAAGTSEARVVLRNPTAERPWQHILDCLSGYLCLAEQLINDASLSGPWNFGPAIWPSAPVEAVVRTFVEHFGYEIAVDVEPDPDRVEELLLALDASRANRRLGWRPRLELDAAIEWTADWYRAHLRGDDMHEQTLLQIASFEQF